MSLNLPSFPVWPELANDLVQRSIQWHLRHILTVVAGSHRATQPQLASRDLQLTHQRPEESRFPASIRADETDDIATLNRCRKVRDQNSSFDLQHYTARYRNLVATSLRGIQPQSHRRRRVCDRRAEPRESTQPFATTLCLFRVLTGDVSPDVVLLLGNHSSLFVISAL